MADFTDAPASITYSVISPNGYPALVSLRDETYKGLQTKMDYMENYFKEKEYKPQVKGFAKKEIEYVKVNGQPMLCPMCKVGHVKIITSAKGTFYGCDTSKFDPSTKTYMGCKYFSNTDPSKINQEDIDIPE